MAIKERPMAQMGRRNPNSSPSSPVSRPAPAPLPPPTALAPAARRSDTPAARRSNTPQKAGVQVEGRISGDATRHQKASRLNEIHHTGAMSISKGMLRPDSAEKQMMLKNGMLRPDSSEKQMLLKSSGGSYSKPDARVKLIPAEEITYVQHRKPYHRSVRSAGAGSQKRHCRRSITPPLSSRKVSVVRMPSVSPKRLETTKNGDSLVGEHVTSSATHQISCLKDTAPPSCKSSQPSSTSEWTGSLPKEASISASPNPKQVFAPRSSEDHLGIEEGSSSKSLCTLESEELLRPRSVFRQQPTLIYPVSPKRLETTKNGASLIGEYVTCSTTHQISCLKDPAPPICKFSRPSITREWPDSLPKEASISASPNPKQMLAPRSSEDHLRVEARSSSKSLCTSEGEEFLRPTSVFRQQPTLIYPDRIRTAAPILRKHVVQHKSIPRLECLQSGAPTQCNTSIKCETSAEFLPRGVQETGAPIILHTKLHKEHCQSETPWKGNFHVTGEVKHFCDGLQAHFPFQAIEKVYRASQQMPEILKLEAVTLSQLWPKTFKMKRPDGPYDLDIGLYFISNHQRTHRSFDDLLEKISSHIGLWTNLGDIELSIFSSKLLSPEYQKKDDRFYFWGIFGKRLRKNQSYHGNYTRSMKMSNLSQPNDYKSADTIVKLNATEETQSVQPQNGMTVNPRGGKERSTTDVVRGDKETNGVTECAAVLGTPNSYPESSCAAPAASADGCCIRKTANKSTSNVADSPSRLNSSGPVLMVNYPPGFSPSTLASDAPSIRKAGQEDGMQVTVEDGENSEPKFPKIRRLSELYGTPQSCTEVFRSVYSKPVDKLQVAEQPEKQRRGKRRMGEP